MFSGSVVFFVFVFVFVGSNIRQDLNQIVSISLGLGLHVMSHCLFSFLPFIHMDEHELVKIPHDPNYPPSPSQC